MNFARHEVVVSPRSLPRKNGGYGSMSISSHCKRHQSWVYFFRKGEKVLKTGKFALCLANGVLKSPLKPCEAHDLGRRLGARLRLKHGRTTPTSPVISVWKKAGSAFAIETAMTWWSA